MQSIHFQQAETPGKTCEMPMKEKHHRPLANKMPSCRKNSIPFQAETYCNHQKVETDESRKGADCNMSPRETDVGRASIHFQQSIPPGCPLSDDRDPHSWGCNKPSLRTSSKAHHLPTRCVTKQYWLPGARHRSPIHASDLWSGP